MKNIISEMEPSITFFVVKVNGVPKYATQSLSVAYELVKTMPKWEIFRFTIEGEDVVSLAYDGTPYSTSETAEGEM